MSFRRKPECLKIEVDLKGVGAIVIDISCADKSHLWLMRFRLSNPIKFDIARIYQAVETIPDFVERLWLPTAHTLLISFVSPRPTLQKAVETVQHVAGHLNLNCSELTWTKLYAREP